MVVMVPWLPLIFWLSWSPKYKCSYDYMCYGYANAPDVFRFAHMFYLVLQRIRKPCQTRAASFAGYMAYLTFGSMCRCFSYPPFVRVIHEDQRGVILQVLTIFNSKYYRNGRHKTRCRVLITYHVTEHPVCILTQINFTGYWPMIPNTVKMKFLPITLSTVPEKSWIWLS